MDKPTSSGAAINNIAGDNTAGAAELLLRAAEVFSLLGAEQRKRECASAEHALERVLRASVALLEAQPAMTPFARLASVAVESAAQANNATAVLNGAETAAQSFAAHAARASQVAAEHAAELVRGCSQVLTHSRSSSVLRAFKLALASGHRFAVVATESRPMMEGRQLASELVRQGAKVTLIADADAASGVELADIVLVGADAVTACNVVNKIGTRLIALAARELGKPVYVVCDTSKFICSAERPLDARRPRDRCELWPDAPDEVEVLNAYFEATPLSFFTAVITEHGAATPEEASRMAERFRLSNRLLEGIACPPEAR